MEYANNNSLNLEFSFDTHQDSIVFLDITLTGCVTSGNIYTRTYRKECAGNSLLLATSCHPVHTMQSVPVGEYIRAKRNCPETSFLEECKVVSSRLQAGGYQNRDRTALLEQSRRKRNKEENTSVTAYSREFKKGQRNYM